MQTPTRTNPRSNLGGLVGEPIVSHGSATAGRAEGSFSESRTLEGRRRAQRQRWGGAVARVRTSLLAYRRTLRAAASRSDRRRTMKRLERLARRSRAIQAELERLIPEVDITMGPEATSLLNPAIGPDASEIAALGAAMRANRQVFMAAEQALDARPPEEVANELQRLKNEALQEAGTINAHIGELCVMAEEPTRT